MRDCTPRAVRGRRPGGLERRGEGRGAGGGDTPGWGVADPRRRFFRLGLRARARVEARGTAAQSPGRSGARMTTRRWRYAVLRRVGWYALRGRSDSTGRSVRWILRTGGACIQCRGESGALSRRGRCRWLDASACVWSHPSYWARDEAMRSPAVGARGPFTSGPAEVWLWAWSPFCYLAAPTAHPVEPRARIGSCRSAHPGAGAHRPRGPCAALGLRHEWRRVALVCSRRRRGPHRTALEVL